jgi:hypothetical protein
VVVAGGAAGGERVVEPEAVLLADAIRVIRERGGAFVRGDDKIGVVGIVASHRRRRNDAPVDAVVGQVEQCAKIVLVAGDALLHVRVAVGLKRRPLEHEAALRSDRDDDDVLHHLRLDEAQDLGPKSSGRSDQRRPPRATLPPRRWTPSKRGE